MVIEAGVVAVLISAAKHGWDFFSRVSDENTTRAKDAKYEEIKALAYTEALKVTPDWSLLEAVIDEALERGDDTVEVRTIRKTLVFAPASRRTEHRRTGPQKTSKKKAKPKRAGKRTAPKKATKKLSKKRKAAPKKMVSKKKAAPKKKMPKRKAAKRKPMKRKAAKKATKRKPMKRRTAKKG